jgi:hypothetical protein
MKPVLAIFEEALANAEKQKSKEVIHHEAHEGHEVQKMFLIFFSYLRALRAFVVNIPSRLYFASLRLRCYVDAWRLAGDSGFLACG